MLKNKAHHKHSKIYENSIKCIAEKVKHNAILKLELLVSNK